MFMIFKKCLFSIVISLQKWQLHIYTAGKHVGTIKIKHFYTLKNNNIVNMINQKKVMGVPLIIGHGHLCMESHLE